MKPQSFAHVTYRADIDGLRSLAVLPVVLFHAGVPWFGGGFIGVDVFFVISGYLITSIIAPQMDSNRFSLLKFYERRARRILPALSAVVAFSLGVGFFILTPRDYSDLGQSSFFTSVFMSNFYFWRSVGYFDPSGSERPLLHTWSLSIEEQFYIFYPLLLMLLMRHFKHLQKVVIISIFCLSFITAAALVVSKPSATFFLGPTRAWELLAGAIIALGFIAPTRQPRVALGSALSGVALICVPVFAYSSSTRFPGLSAVPPVLGAGLLIWSGMNHRTLVHRVLSIKVVVELGRASYSLYLWHFPLLAFATYLSLGKLDPEMALLICIVSIGASFASLHLIERPFRFPPQARFGPRLAWAAVIGIAVAGVAGALVSLNSGVPSRLDEASRRLLAAEGDKDRHPMRCLNVVDVTVPPSKACRLGQPTAEPATLLWGDSHAAVTATALEQAALRNKASFLFSGSVDCPIGLGIGIYDKVGPTFVSTPAYRYCRAYNDEMLQLASRPEIKTVVLSSRWTNWRIGEPGSQAEAAVDIRLYDVDGPAGTQTENRLIFQRGFESLINALVSRGKTVWIVGPLPEPAYSVPRALFVQHLGFNEHALDIPLDEFERKHRWILSLFRDLGQNHEVRFLWPHVELCSNAVCAVSEHETPLYFDHNHLSISGAAKTSSIYDRVFAADSN